jgi:hypothetical protein
VGGFGWDDGGVKVASVPTHDETMS